MSVLSRKLGTLFRKSVPAALVEVTLIFVGITLALMFENWNAERVERKEERELLLELRSNLSENARILEEGIAANRRRAVGIETVLEHLAEQTPFPDELSETLAGLENWASPYLTSSAYETLKSRGLDLISDPERRAEIVRLFDGTYANLTQDQDRAEWINYEVSMLPMLIAHIDEAPNQQARVVDFEALLTQQDFRRALLRTLALRMQTIARSEDAVAATNALIDKL